MSPRDPAQHPSTFPVFSQSRTESSIPPLTMRGPVCAVLSIPWDEQGFEARQPNIIHLYLLVAQLSWAEQAESGKLSLSVCHSDPLNCSKPLGAATLPPA